MIFMIYIRNMHICEYRDDESYYINIYIIDILILIFHIDILILLPGSPYAYVYLYYYCNIWGRPLIINIDIHYIYIY